MLKNAIDICAILAMPHTNQTRLTNVALRSKVIHASSLSGPSFFGSTECRILKTRMTVRPPSHRTITVECTALLNTICDKVRQRQSVEFEVTGALHKRTKNTDVASSGDKVVSDALNPKDWHDLIIDGFEIRLGQYQIEFENHTFVVNRAEDIQLCELLLSSQEDMRRSWHFEDLFDKIDAQLLTDGSQYVMLLREYRLAAFRLNNLFKTALGYRLLLVDEHADKISVNPKLYLPLQGQ